MPRSARLPDKEKVRRLRQLLGLSDVRRTRAAQCFLGTCYEGGTGIVRDAAEAGRWAQLAAEQGHAKAQGLRAQLYGLR
eukprot:m.173479 g.173479  ORF g.173479 m.173479 type:complete len:79 (-) comp24321_c1_seq1:312-548(-)